MQGGRAALDGLRDPRKFGYPSQPYILLPVVSVTVVVLHPDPPTLSSPTPPFGYLSHPLL